MTLKISSKKLHQTLVCMLAAAPLFHLIWWFNTSAMGTPHLMTWWPIAVAFSLIAAFAAAVILRCFMGNLYHFDQGDSWFWQFFALLVYCIPRLVPFYALVVAVHTLIGYFLFGTWPPVRYWSVSGSALRIVGTGFFSSMLGAYVALMFVHFAPQKRKKLPEAFSRR